MKMLLRFCFMGLLSAILLAGCGGGGGGSGTTGGDTTGMSSVVTKAYSAVSAAICSSGGIQVDAGIDDNGNGALDLAEVDSTQYVCNGTNGTSGTNGSNGLSALVSVTTETAGANCTTGGNKVSVGLDANGNGILDTAEITSSNYICTGANGTNGTNGANGTNGLTSLTAVVTEAAGGNCANGGLKTTSGLDANANSILDAGEITTTSYVCNGTNGSNGTNGTNGTNGLTSLTAIVTEAGGANCANGGLKTTFGLDANVNSILDAGEVTTTTYVCNGLNGTNGTNGTNGNTAPIANAGPDQKVAGAGSLVTLSGSGTDANGNTLTYVWSYTAKPVGSAATLSSLTAVGPTFTADKAGKYVLSLVVNDGTFNSVSDTITVRAGTPVPDTGQTRWYSTAFGDDGDYTINPMSYADNFDGTITDNVTGLTWQKCSMGQSGADCATGVAATYNWYQASGTPDATYNPGGATKVCGNLSLAGTGWRLPTDFELMSIVDYGRYNPAINTSYFSNTQSSSGYLSSTTYAGNTMDAWYVNFYDGSASYSNKANTGYVRCVSRQ